ncbi:hypothetical protein ADK57_36135 [Streptomyces sp. MMG1533]|nr:hypothetical protein ADK57_36135 [Streptomyces sp. MMG1533]
MDAAPDGLLVVDEKYPDFSVFAHAVGVTHAPEVRPRETLPVSWVTEITCRCSGPLQGCDQELFPISRFYLEIQAKTQVRRGFTEMWSTG